MTTVYITGFPGPAGILDAAWRQFPVTTVDLNISTERVLGMECLLRVTYPTGSPQYVAAQRGRSTVPGDTPSNTYVPGKLYGDVNYGISLFDGIEPQDSGQGGLGVVTLLDPEGELDSIVNSAWDGATVEVMRGDPAGQFSSFTVAATATANGILYDQRKKQIRFRDLSALLQSAPLHDKVYAGTGSAEGGSDLTGVDKPYAVGRVFNVEPVLINGASLIYQLTCCPMASVTDVRDGGVSLAYSSVNTNTYAQLVSATVPAGTYATCRQLGLIRLGSTVVYALRADFDGDNEVISGQSAPMTIGQIVRRIAIGRGTIKLTDSQIDMTALAAFESEQPATCGFYWRTQPTKAEAITEVLQSCLGFWAAKLTGLLTIGLLEAPSGTPAATFQYPADFGNGEPRQNQAYQAPRTASYVGYLRNYGVMSANQIAGSVNQTTAGIYQRDTQWGSQINASIATTWPTAPTRRVYGGYTTKTDADSEAARQQTLMQTRRERWQLELVIDPFSDLLGRVIEIQGFTRYGWAGSKKFLVIGMSFASGLSVTLDLWC